MVLALGTRAAELALSINGSNHEANRGAPAIDALRARCRPLPRAARRGRHKGLADRLPAVQVLRAAFR